MAAGRALKGLVGRRRRADEDGEEEDDGPEMVEHSQSEGSVLSDLEDDEYSSVGAGTVEGGMAHEEPGAEVVIADGVTKAAGTNARKTKRQGGRKQQAESAAGSSAQARSQAGAFKITDDTQAMMNGLRIDDQTLDEAIDFESVSRRGSVAVATPAPPPPANGHTESAGYRQRQDHEDYRKKRDADPAFIPNRGNFFMHDTRSNHGSIPGRGAWGGRGRGRGGGTTGAPYPPGAPVAQSEKAAEQPWKHDLHDTINEESSRPVHARDESARIFPKSQGPNQSNQQRVLSFSSTKLVGKVQIRVFLDGMKAPFAFPEVPWKHYIRLPDHRPPLRRDKPVRVSLPGHPQRYIFPAAERSFIFIPRQMRPNQQGFGRNAYQRSVGGYGYSSRRTSMYGGSMYAASVAASRRSSFASVSRENAFSPVGSYGSNMPPSRPNVRMPHGSQSHFPTSGTPLGYHTPTGMQIHTFPLPQQPTYQGIPTTTVHQPRPQKTISVTGIESPAALQQAPGAQDAQPFQNQLPAHMNDQMGFNHGSALYSPQQQFQYPQQPPSATPLSGIPEQAIHAPSFQPPVMAYGNAPYYAPYGPPQQNYYYPQGSGGFQPMPMYAPPPQGYMMSPPAPVLPSQQAPPQAPPSRPTEDAPQQMPQAPSGMVAHESNGMVFYLPASEAPQQPQGESYQPAESFVPSYAMPGLPPPTPAPETSYYYPPQVPMQQVGYYPGPTQQ